MGTAWASSRGAGDAAHGRATNRRNEAHAAVRSLAVLAPRWWPELDQQHAWVLVGDDRGVYGNYTPKGID